MPVNCAVKYLCVCSQAQNPKGKVPEGKILVKAFPIHTPSHPSQSTLWVPGDFIVTTLLETRKVLPSLQKLLPRSGELQQNKKMAELLSAALIPCSPLRLSFLLSVPWAELHFYRNKFVPISQTQVRCSKSRSQAQFSIAACLWQLKWWLYLLMTV